MAVVVAPPAGFCKNTHDIYIKIFLVCCHRFCKEYYSVTVKQIWANTQNFPSLLNLSDQTELFGSITLSWDRTFEAVIGDVKGKGILRSTRQNPQYLLPRMLLLHKKYAVDKTCEQFVWHKRRQGDTREDDLKEPEFKRRHGLDGYVPIYH